MPASSYDSPAPARTPARTSARTPARQIDPESPHFIGVRPLKSGFKAEITIKGEKRDCGVHATAEDAARARDAEAMKEGVKRLNFPLEAFEESPAPTKKTKTPAKTPSKTPTKTPVKSPAAKTPIKSPVRPDSPAVATEEDTEEEISAGPSLLKKLIWVLMPVLIILISYYLRQPAVQAL
uniref:AP2/ERF domain-containing protein n=1 Tax=Pyramimonas obovata TaxID=1411642 RepID=A0A7S0WNN1_9CHLO|mmetsp:Transcript_32419/g.70792  ORF Transcript_32419/g.70792 Transcript_32419/m.70792 type:complete len:180 (+) Transcript_32419:129-668(+)|eukprot:CAMPEP_0118921914 /NCGR_PEP_ID=MMETSP1169-20130426/1045_1 /TAXON_ID=36882 /ORGANISM="Pyramimonas obovata, Strain CCMP722" /LENGTH=179 /DNA_ID=CAMNT_0006862719 /DNA_START=129 /DNA_END=668 /DNA_ORIENTATION=+